MAERDEAAVRPTLLLVSPLYDSDVCCVCVCVFCGVDRAAMDERDPRMSFALFAQRAGILGGGASAMAAGGKAQ